MVTRLGGTQVPSPGTIAMTTCLEHIFGGRPSASEPAKRPPYYPIPAEQAPRTGRIFPHGGDFKAPPPPGPVLAPNG